MTEPRDIPVCAECGRHCLPAGDCWGATVARDVAALADLESSRINTNLLPWTPTEAHREEDDHQMTDDEETP